MESGFQTDLDTIIHQYMYTARPAIHPIHPPVHRTRINWIYHGMRGEMAIDEFEHCGGQRLKKLLGHAQSRCETVGYRLTVDNLWSRTAKPGVL